MTLLEGYEKNLEKTLKRIDKLNLDESPSNRAEMCALQSDLNYIERRIKELKK